MIEPGQNRDRAWALLAVAVLTVAVLAAACGTSSSSRPTEADARNVLNNAVSLAETGDVAGLCDMHGSHTDICVNDLTRLGGRASAPGSAPRIVASGSISDGTGWRLAVCGRDGFERPYVTDFVVYSRDGMLDVPYPVYWSGRIVGGDGTGNSSATAEAPPRATRVAC